MKIPPSLTRLCRAFLAATRLVIAAAPGCLLAQGGVRPDPEDPVQPTPASATLQLGYPTLTVPENRAYIPLIFQVNAPWFMTGNVVVRATFVGGTATPGEDFSLATPEREVPAAFGFGWVEIPLIQDEVNEGDETASFELSIVGSTNPPVRMEVTILDDLATGEVGFVSTRFSANEGSPRGFAELRLWRTLNTRNKAVVTFKVDGKPGTLAVLGDEPRRVATFQPGESQAFVRIPLVNNDAPDGTREFTLTIESSDDGAKAMAGFQSTVLTLGDDETLPAPSPLTIREDTSEDGERGVMLSTQVPRGYQVRLEYSDTGLGGPWQPYWTFEGSDAERITFNRYNASTQRLFRALPPEPLELTFPW